MLTPRHLQAGLSLIELAIGLVILAILMGVAIPSFQEWIQSTQIRTGADSIQNGVQLARAEAVRRNAPVRFDLTAAGGTIAWNVGCVTASAECPATIQSHSAGDGTTNARAGVDTATPPSPVPAGYYGAALAAGAGLPAGVTFDGLGRVPGANIGADITRVDVTSAVNANARRMVVVVGSGGVIRMCDPALSLASNPQGCS
ncbi:MAG: GspH/FimT family pseudopilin [Pseudomonadota bacterium]